MLKQAQREKLLGFLFANSYFHGELGSEQKQIIQNLARFLKVDGKKTKTLLLEQRKGKKGNKAGNNLHQLVDKVRPGLKKILDDEKLESFLLGLKEALGVDEKLDSYEELLSGIEHEDPKVRSISLQDFIVSNHPDKIPVLKNRLSLETDLQLKYELRKSIHELSSLHEIAAPVQEGSANRQKLALFLKDEDLRKRRKALAFIQSKELVEYLPLLERLFQTWPDQSLALALLKLYSKSPTHHYEKVLTFLESSDERVISNALETLEVYGSTKALSLVSSFASHESNRVRASALKVLYNLGDAGAMHLIRQMCKDKRSAYRDSAAYVISALELEEALPELAVLLEDSTESVRRKAIETIRSFANNGSAGAVELLEKHRLGVSQEKRGKLKALESDRSEIRVKGAKALDSSTSLEEIKNLFLEERDPKVLASLVMACIKWEGDSKSLCRLIFEQILTHADGRVRANGIEVIQAHSDSSDRQQLRAFLQDENNRVVGNTIVALLDNPSSAEEGYLDKPSCEGEERLEKVSSAEEEQLSLSLSAEEDHLDKPSIEEEKLKKILSQEEETLDQDCLKALKRLLSDPRKYHRLTGVYVVGALARLSWIDSLEPLLRDPDEEVSQKTQACLINLSNDSSAAAAILDRFESEKSKSEGEFAQKINRSEQGSESVSVLGGGYRADLDTGDLKELYAFVKKSEREGLESLLKLRAQGKIAQALLLLKSGKIGSAQGNLSRYLKARLLLEISRNFPAKRELSSLLNSEFSELVQKDLFSIKMKGLNFTKALRLYQDEFQVSDPDQAIREIAQILEWRNQSYLAFEFLRDARSSELGSSDNDDLIERYYSYTFHDIYYRYYGYFIMLLQILSTGIVLGIVVYHARYLGPSLFALFQAMSIGSQVQGLSKELLRVLEVVFLSAALFPVLLINAKMLFARLRSSRNCYIEIHEKYLKVCDFSKVYHLDVSLRGREVWIYQDDSDYSYISLVRHLPWVPNLTYIYAFDEIREAYVLVPLYGIADGGLFIEDWFGHKGKKVGALNMIGVRFAQLCTVLDVFGRGTISFLLLSLITAVYFASHLLNALKTNLLSFLAGVLILAVGFAFYTYFSTIFREILKKDSVSQIFCFPIIRNSLILLAGMSILRHYLPLGLIGLIPALALIALFYFLFVRTRYLPREKQIVAEISSSSGEALHYELNRTEFVLAKAMVWAKRLPLYFNRESMAIPVRVLGMTLYYEVLDRKETKLCVSGLDDSKTLMIFGKHKFVLKHSTAEVVSRLSELGLTYREGEPAKVPRSRFSPAPLLASLAIFFGWQIFDVVNTTIPATHSQDSLEETAALPSAMKGFVMRNGDWVRLGEEIVYERELAREGLTFTLTQSALPTYRAMEENLKSSTLLINPAQMQRIPFLRYDGFRSSAVDFMRWHFYKKFQTVEAQRYAPEFEAYCQAMGMGVALSDERMACQLNLNLENEESRASLVSSHQGLEQFPQDYFTTMAGTLITLMVAPNTSVGELEARVIESKDFWRHLTRFKISVSFSPPEVLLNQTDFLLEMIKQSPGFLVHLPPSQLLKDEVIQKLDSVLSNVEGLKDLYAELPLESRSQLDLIEIFAKRSPVIARDIPEKTLASPEFKARFEGFVEFYSQANMWGNKEYVLEQVRDDAMLLSKVKEELKRDQDVVLAAAKRDFESVKYAHSDAFDDELLTELVKLNSEVVSFIPTNVLTEGNRFEELHKIDPNMVYSLKKGVMQSTNVLDQFLNRDFVNAIRFAPGSLAGVSDLTNRATIQLSELFEAEKIRLARGKERLSNILQNQLIVLSRASYPANELEKVKGIYKRFGEKVVDAFDRYQQEIADLKQDGFDSRESSVFFSQRERLLSSLATDIGTFINEQSTVRNSMHSGLDTRMKAASDVIHRLIKSGIWKAQQHLQMQIHEKELAKVYAQNLGTLKVWLKEVKKLENPGPLLARICAENPQARSLVAQAGLEDVLEEWDHGIRFAKVYPGVFSMGRDRTQQEPQSNDDGYKPPVGADAAWKAAMQEGEDQRSAYDRAYLHQQNQGMKTPPPHPPGSPHGNRGSQPNHLGNHQGPGKGPLHHQGRKGAHQGPGHHKGGNHSRPGGGQKAHGNHSHSSGGHNANGSQSHTGGGHNPHGNQSHPVVGPSNPPHPHHRQHIKKADSEKTELFGGSFDAPLHKVEIERAFFIAQTEITQKQWSKVMGGNPSVNPGCDSCPVENISYLEVQSFLDKLNETHGCSRTQEQVWKAKAQGKNEENKNCFRLPTEAEWEYACKGGEDREAFLTQDAHGFAWFRENSELAVQPVGQMQPTGFTLFDMLGNVSEWVQDFYSSSYYLSSPSIDPLGPKEGSERVVRGGSVDSVAENLKCSVRASNSQESKSAYRGFRIVQEL